MMPPSIRIYGDPVLRTKSTPMERTEIDAAFREFIQAMAESMYAHNGVGLASNQVGVAKRFFIADVKQVLDPENRRTKRRKDPARRELLVFINPEILESSVEDSPFAEGCLSIPELEKDVYRPDRIKVRYRDLDWLEREEWLDGYLARVFQHELDHLDGVMFVDHLPPEERRAVTGHLNRLKKQQDEIAAEIGTKD